MFVIVLHLNIIYSHVWYSAMIHLGLYCVHLSTVIVIMFVNMFFNMVVNMVVNMFVNMVVSTLTNEPRE